MHASSIKFTEKDSMYGQTILNQLQLVDNTSSPSPMGKIMSPRMVRNSQNDFEEMSEHNHSTHSKSTVLRRETGIGANAINANIVVMKASTNDYGKN